MNFSMRHFVLVVLVAMLAGCAAKRPAPVSDSRPPAVPKAPPSDIAPVAAPIEAPKPVDIGKVYTIQKGDTLISIALSNGLDYRELAAWNNIENPNAIKLGVTLRLTAPGSAGDASAGVAGAQPQPGLPVTAPLVTPPPPIVAGALSVNTDKLKTEPKAFKVPYTDQAYAKLSTEAGAPDAGVPAALPAQAPPSTPAVSAAGGDDVNWAWPIQPIPKGRIVAMFTEANKGVDISGSKGSPILAAASGKVVYTGAGFRGYGRLVIVKHNANWLSAYAHNEKILVAEGDEVKQGQKIAEMGSSDADQVKLHFEIRKQGKPLDPLKFLPN